MENRPGAAAPPIEESTDRIRTAADDTMSAVKQTARETADTVKSAAHTATDAVKEKARTAMDDVQAEAAAQSRTASSTLRETAGRLDGELPWMKTALDRTADGFDHLTTALNRGDVGQALNGLSDFARRQPALFIGLSVAAGFALARVGKTAFEGVQDSAEPKADGIDKSVAPYAPGMEV